MQPPEPHYSRYQSHALSDSLIPPSQPLLLHLVFPPDLRLFAVDFLFLHLLHLDILSVLRLFSYDWPLLSLVFPPDLILFAVDFHLVFPPDLRLFAVDFRFLPLLSLVFLQI